MKDLPENTDSRQTLHPYQKPSDEVEEWAIKILIAGLVLRG